MSPEKVAPICENFQVNLDRERSERASMESQLREKMHEIMSLQAKHDSSLAEYNAK